MANCVATAATVASTAVGMAKVWRHDDRRSINSAPMVASGTRTTGRWTMSGWAGRPPMSVSSIHSSVQRNDPTQVRVNGKEWVRPCG